MAQGIKRLDFAAGAYLEEHANAEAHRAGPEQPAATNTIDEDHTDQRAETSADIVDACKQLRFACAVACKGKHDGRIDGDGRDAGPALLQHVCQVFYDEKNRCILTMPARRAAK